MSNIINPPILSYSENVYSHDHAYVSRPYASINSGEFDFNIIYHTGGSGVASYWFLTHVYYATGAETNVRVRKNRYHRMD